MSKADTKILVNNILKSLFYKILRIQVKNVAVASDGYLSRTEMHLLECIDDNPGIILTGIAQNLSVTKATASVSLTTLKKKGYLDKQKLSADKRKSIFVLTQKGKLCSARHRKFHDDMVNSVLNEFRIEEYPHVIKSLQALLDFFEKSDN